MNQIRFRLMHLPTCLRIGETVNEQGCGLSGTTSLCCQAVIKTVYSLHAPGAVAHSPFDWNSPSFPSSPRNFAMCTIVLHFFRPILSLTVHLVLPAGKHNVPQESDSRPLKAARLRTSQVSEAMWVSFCWYTMSKGTPSFS